MILTGYSIAAGIVALTCAALLVAVKTRAAEAFPAADGAHARRFQFGWRVCNALFDASVLLSLAWTHRAASPRVSLVALVGAGASYLVSYQLARGQGLGYSGRESTALRVATAALLVLAVLGDAVAPVWVETSLWLFGVVVVAGAFWRASDVRAQDRKPVTSGRTA